MSLLFHNKCTGKAPEQDFTSQSSSSVMDSLVSEVGDFEAELEKFLSDSNDVDEVVATLDDGTDKLCKVHFMSTNLTCDRILCLDSTTLI